MTFSLRRDPSYLELFETSTDDHEHRRILPPINYWSTKQLLTALDDRGIRYPPTATRADLELLFQASANDGRAESAILTTTRSSEKVLPTTEETLRSRDGMRERAQRRARRKRRHEHHAPTRPPSSWSQTVVTLVPKMAGNLFDRATRKARRVQRRAADVWAIDEVTGVRDVRYEYLHKQQQPEVANVPVRSVEVIVERKSGQGDRDVADDGSFPTPPRRTQSQPLDDLETTAPFVTRPNVAATSQSRRPSPFKQREPQRGRLSDERHKENENAPRRPPRPCDGDSRASRGSQFLLPSSNVADDKNYPPPNWHRWRPRRRVERPKMSPPRKKVYSPYASWSPGIEVHTDATDDDRDAIDRVAEFLADTAERVMWGMFDHPPEPPAPPNKPPTGSKQRSRPHQPRRRHRHWKDHLEERLDSLMGLHENGDFYNEWAARAEKEKQEEGGDDAVLVAKGRKAKKMRKPTYDKPFWEDEGNLISSLFGRTHRGKDLFFENSFRSGSVLLLVRTLLKSFLVVGSYLCRWASTQGALPQPVVVMGVTAAGLCARPSRRLLAVGVALLLMRTVGEVVYGYAYGLEGWEDDDDTDNYGHDEQSDDYDE